MAEPLGGLLALFGALFEDDVRAVSVHGGLAGYESLLLSPFCYVPHDACFDKDGNIFVVEWVQTGRVTLLKKVA